MASNDRHDVTEVLARLSKGAPGEADRLLELVYDDLRDLAARRLRDGPPVRGLEPTEVIHEVYLRLVEQSRIDWQGRTHFYAVSARAIRMVLVDAARRASALKRGGRGHSVRLDHDIAPCDDGSVDLVALEDALERLAALSARQARIVELRFFGGLSCEEVAVVLGVSRRTVQGDWSMARSWLRRELGA